MSRSKVLPSLGFVAAIGFFTTAGCVVEVVDDDGEEFIEDVADVDSSLGVGSGVERTDVVRSTGRPDGEERTSDDAPTGPIDALGSEEEPDPVPWTPGKSGTEGGGSNDEG